MTDDPAHVVQPARVRHPRLGFSVVLPGDWEVFWDGRERVALVALEPAHDTPHRTNAVVTVDELGPDDDLRDWMATNDAAMVDALRDLLVIDDHPAVVDGRPGWHRTFHHTSEAGVSLTAEQWSVVVGGLGLTLTTTVETLVAVQHDDEVGRAAASFEVARVDGGSR